MFSIRFTSDLPKLQKHWIHKYGGISFSDLIIEESQAYRNKLEKMWKTKEARLIKELNLVTGLTPEGTYTVYALHPRLEEGQYIGKREIEWAYDDLYPNYMILGITHELLHCLTHDFYQSLSDDEKWVFHAMVYLSVDEEMYKRMNSVKEYFSSPILNSYHPRLITTARSILPYWEKRVQENFSGNLYDFYKERPKSA